MRKQKKKSRHSKQTHNRQYKDRLWRMIFNNKEDLLQLYNAINYTDYQNPDDLEVNTLEDVLYLSMKNDVSFLVGGTMNLYEHQSTFNPNMPLRGVFYFSRLYEGYVADNNLMIYHEKRVRLPKPKYIVFYNGTKNQPDSMELKLSDCFENTDNDAPCLECTATMLNINYGHNQELMKHCRRLKEYSNVSANVTYKYNNKTYTKPYAKPVIQVDASTVPHTVVKQWEYDSDKVAVDVELKAYVTEAADSNINAGNPKYLTSADVKNLPTSMQFNLSETNNWTHTWENLPTKYFYKAADGSIKETDIHYTVEEVQTDATKAFYGQVTESSDGKTTTILNKKKDQEDKPFIEVTKTFKGLTKDQIRELAKASSPYTITLTHIETNTTKPLTMDVSELDSILQGSDDEKVWTYTWKLEDCLDGTYKVSENNYNKEGYDVTVTVNEQTVTDWNEFSVSTKKAEIGSYDPSGNSITTCAPTEFQIGKVNLIVAQLTGNEGYFVWTRTPVSISERRVIVQLISDKKDGIGFSPKATLEKCYFYSGNGIKDTLVFKNGEIKYDEQAKLTFDASKQWTMFAAGTYTFKETQNAEIQITNTYSEQTADLDLIKTSTSVAGTKFDGAEFKLYKKNDEGAYELHPGNKYRWIRS